MKLKAALLLSTLALLLVPAVQAQDYASKSLSLLVYNDGVVQVDYEAETDPSLVRIEVELPGFPYESLLVVDQDGLPLDASVTDEGVSVDTLGSTGVVVTYLTSSLTSKTGA
ncbi:transcriptional regulator, partial [Candidatus Bathyarchaeota archaeon]|nr:transcriptional regulator [Candidatus Bathyarchaeota archaeon]